VVHEPEFDAAILEKSQLELELSDAPENGQMRLVYQPYMDLASRSISG
jgi:EAL domain-containing protein (putative c-di-GMP-specific phosphodiesterase class I)